MITIGGIGRSEGAVVGTLIIVILDRVLIEDIDSYISSLSSTITALTAEKADYEQLKTDLEAL